MKKMKNVGISDDEINLLISQWEAAKKDIENKFKVKEDDDKKRDFTAEDKAL